MTEPQAPTDSTGAPHDLVVVSDLHLGRGFNKRTRRFHALETFFFDDDFQSFCRFLRDRASQRGRGVRLVLNGDTFDFLRILPGPGAEPEPAARPQRFSSELTPETAEEMVREILEGHPLFVQGLALLLSAGHSVIMLPGNHDLEVHWRRVQDAIRASIGAALSTSGTAAAAVSRLEFHPWFYFEPGRVWIEHGCQYDPENAFRFPLRGRLADEPGFEPKAEVDLPLGNFFQRYLYNAFGSITFIVPSSRASGRYFRWLLFNEPRLLVRVLRVTLPFAFQVLRRLAQGHRDTRDRYEQAHRAQLEALARASGLGPKLEEIEALKQGGADALVAVQAIVRQSVRLVATTGITTVGVLILWTTLGSIITELSVGFGLKTLLTLVLDFLLLSGTVGFVGYRLLRLQAPVAPRPLLRAAERICAIAQVPLAIFGHTHEEVVYSLEGSGEPERRYVNSGTWIAVFTHDVLLPREQVQFTFVDIAGADAQLMFWSPGRNAALPVILLDDGAAAGGALTHSTTAPA